MLRFTSIELTDLLDETVCKGGRISRSADTIANFNAAQILHRKLISMLWWRWPSSKPEAIVSGMWNANPSVPLTTLMIQVPPPSAFATSLVNYAPSPSPHKANVGTILHPRLLPALQLRNMVHPPILSSLPSALTTGKDNKIYTTTDRSTPRPRAATKNPNTNIISNPIYNPVHYSVLQHHQHHQRSHERPPQLSTTNAGGLLGPVTPLPPAPSPWIPGALFVRHPESALDMGPVRYAASDLDYVGETICLKSRGGQHTCATLRFRLALPSKRVPYATKKFARGREAGSKVTMVPIALASIDRRVRRAQEEDDIRLIRPSRNTERGLRNALGLGRVSQSMGATQRRRRRAARGEPSTWQVKDLKLGVPTPYRATTSFVLEPEGLESSHIEALVPHLTAGSVISVTTRTKDSSFWSMAVEMLEGSRWRQVHDVGPSAQPIAELTTRDVARMCRAHGSNPLPLSFEAVHIERQVWRLWGKSPRLRLEARLRALPDQRARQAKIIYIQMVSSYEPTGWRRHQCETQIAKVARSLRVRLVPNQLTVRVPYAEELGKAALKVALRRVVKGLGFSSCLTGFIANRVRVVTPREAGSFPTYYTHRRMTNGFGLTPPPCSNRCRLTPQGALPRQDGCVCTTAVEAPHLSAVVKALRYSRKTIPSVGQGTANTLATAAIEALKDTLTPVFNYAVELPREEVMALAESCVLPRPSRVLSTETLTHADLRVAKAILYSDFVGPMDKDPGNTVIMCPHLAWELSMQTFEWRTPDAPFALSAKMEPLILEEMEKGYKFQHLAKWGAKGRIALAEVWVKYYPLAKDARKFKARPLSRCCVEPFSTLERKAARAAVAIFQASIDTDVPHLPTVAGLLPRLKTMAQSLLASTDSSPHSDWVTSSASDDVVGCYGALDPGVALQLWEKFADRMKESAKKGQCCAYVACPNDPVVLGSEASYRRPQGAVVYDLDTITEIMRYTLRFRSVRLGTLVLEQKGGLFQGRPLSVVLCLVALDEMERCGPSSMIRSVRYVDDKFSIVASRSSSTKTPEERVQTYNQRYDSGLTLESEARFPTGEWLFLGALLNEKPGDRAEYTAKALVKNSVYPTLQLRPTLLNIPGVTSMPVRTQVFRTESPNITFRPRQELRAQRRARINALLTITDDDPGRRKSVVKAKLYEYLYCLGVPPYEVARTLLDISRGWPDLAASLSSMRTWLRREISRSKRTT